MKNRDGLVPGMVSEVLEEDPPAQWSNLQGFYHTGGC